MKKQEYSEKLIADIVAFVEANGGKDCLSAIILTGSFGRNEPTWDIDENGDAVLRSDVEIALVRKPGHGKKESLKIVNKLKSHFEEDLSMMAFSERRIRNAHNLNNSFWESRFKTVFTFDLFNGSKTIWGRDYLKERKIVVEDIDPYEAKRIVANRIAEMIYLLDGEKKGNEYTRKQWKGKAMLAIGSAWLLMKNKYVSSYHGQRDALLQGTAIKEYLGEDFVDAYQKTFSFLRDGGAEFEVDDDKLREYVGLINQKFEKESMTKAKVNNLMRLVKYTLKYIKAGGGYGIINFENAILTSIINQYVQGDDDNLRHTAQVWYKCIY